MAKLYFRYGAMGSSKSANALMAKFNYEERGQQVLLLKPKIDTRNGSNIVSSRIGLSSPCLNMKALHDLQSGSIDVDFINQYDCIIVDEAQFCSDEEIDTLAHIVDSENIPVICYGLRTDFQRKLFPGSKRLMEVADTIEEIKTICWCGHKATCNARFNERGIVRDGEQVELGSNDKYIAVCRKHYLSGELFGENKYLKENFLCK